MHSPLLPADRTRPERRDQHLAVLEEAAGLDDQVTDRLELVVQEEVHHGSDLAVGGIHGVPFKVFEAAQHSWFLSASRLIGPHAI